MSNVADEGETGLNQYPNQALGLDFYTDAQVGTVNNAASPMRITGCTITAGAGVPVIGGNLNDLYIRTDAAGETTYFYRCTTAGAAGAAVWAAMSGA
jgi:hypothetical protein